MVDIRTTRVALLVDREVDRDVQTSRIALLVDRETDVDLVTEELYAIADIEHNVDLIVEELYFIADIEDASPWEDIFYQIDEFEISPNYDLQDTWTQEDLFRNLRGDLWELYLAIVAHLNEHGPGPGPDEYDINDDGIITPEDALIVLNWYNTGILTKFLRPVLAWQINYHNWPNIPRTWSETWTQIQAFSQSLQHLGYTSIQTQIELWYNPGDINVTLPNIQTQTDSYLPSLDLNKFNDNLIQEDVFDPSFPAKERAWSDNFYQTDHFDTASFFDLWHPIEAWILGETNLTFQDHWDQVSSIRPPHKLHIAQDWVQTQVYNSHTPSAHFEHAWIHTEKLDTPTNV
jgi:hypothetical protein